ncbi:hypothetical protein GCM10027275_02990 [Rhabdobacter roseus]|uniref:Uncharacterized protein n=1 Tax=Rhabdobacter roseus TaxID=1655419 RepID=A0A840TK59_9BACT|nr:DUF5908 family protein [Rhabdobacter roseus]MBB5282187.1 hypothetical protein [Rhabdobacter roseus]
MPVLIRELHIKVSVNALEAAQGTSGGSLTPGTSAPPEDRERLVAECVEQVLSILKSQREP